MIQRHPLTLLLATCLLLPACKEEPVIEAPRDEREYVGKDSQVHVSLLRFEDPATGDRFHKVRDCFGARAQGGEWQSYPLRKIGNFVEEDWCQGEGSELGCAGGNFRERRGSEWLSVYTLHYPKDFPGVFGLGVSSGKLPASGEWGAAFSYYADGKSIIGDGVGLSFHRFEAEEIVQVVTMGDSYSYQAEESYISITAPDGYDAELARLISSPESLRDTAVKRYDALQAEVESQIHAGTVQKCIYGEYKGDGIPPECHLTPLTGPERKALLDRAKRDIGAQRDAVKAHHALFLGLLRELVDFENCW